MLQEKLTAYNSFVVRSKFDNLKIALFFHVIRDDFKPFLLSIIDQVPNGHEDDELADGEVMNYMCQDDEVKSVLLAIKNQ